MDFEPSSYKSFNRHPNWPIFLNIDGPKGVKGATEEDKMKPDGSMSLGQGEANPFPVKIHGE